MGNSFEDLKNDHRNFDKGKLEDRFDLAPWDLFKEWMEESVNQKVIEPNALCLSTVSESGQPSSRIVYLKDIIDQNLVFYTNYLSQKGTHIHANNQVSMLFFWPELERQIRVEGKASFVSDELSDAYFQSRPRSSQLGAWASLQSQILESKTEIEKRMADLEKQYPNFVPRPPHWGGYAVKPELFEFWQGRPSRLHDRLIFQSEGENWKVFRRFP